MVKISQIQSVTIITDLPFQLVVGTANIVMMISRAKYKLDHEGEVNSLSKSPVNSIVSDWPV